MPRSTLVWLSDEEADVMRRSGWCSYPQCTCIVSTTTSRPIPLCPLGLEDSYVGQANRALWKRR